MTLKGSALRSRRMEPFLRRFLMMPPAVSWRTTRDGVRDDYLALAERIRRRELRPEEIAAVGNDQ